MRVEQIRLVTYRWDAMRQWWAAILDTPFAAAGSRTVIAEDPRLVVVLEHSPIAMNASSEVAGIASITVATPSVADASATVHRLAALGSATIRATDDRLGIRIWYRDPDGCDVALRLPFYPTMDNPINTEINPFHTLDLLHAAANPKSAAPNIERRLPWQSRIRHQQ